jgi:hypothetical protein
MQHLVHELLPHMHGFVINIPAYADIFMYLIRKEHIILKYTPNFLRSLS